MSLTVESLSIEKGPVKLVCDAKVKAAPGESVAVVGESGSGKSLTALAVLKLLPENLKVKGKVEVDGTDVLSLQGERLRRFRWEKVSMVFQDPSSSLNPLMKVGEQVAEALKFHGFKGDFFKRVVELFELCEIPDPERVYHAYPHQLSGGLKQRVAIAMALACSPGYLIADEPTTALDVTVQARILRLFKRLVREQRLGLALITHDMGVVKEVAQKVFVMYAGYTVEWGRTSEVLGSPLHPYTEGLINCTPELKCSGKGKLRAIPGSVPDPSQRPSGCPFHSRCYKAKEVCKKKTPPVREVNGRGVRCFFPNY
ncbi:oligopeptide/dipeptide ABC transporter, ATPase subunit [Thermovibrio ammonificans HB-1]|uniref:Oligopeptide/dipeptide ABC transporter, ATPase subunit n=1 Tax=Thermovibrio ammonificans (strain DSM 15698 / JCM 12110 / HB-1) TaxID=648996 RepID=E8T5P2_THEA1|nr:ABC transporter ATP-binding protein [Thermovibrio ammonificans]ADU96517.1 oligopeptide/dipeptide ABC transporter, ATPase subunit [Thermovibrio ammonificans HB-1]